MSTITLKDAANADVAFTEIGKDLTNARYSALGQNTATLNVDLLVNQQRTALGSKASKRATVKAVHEEAADLGSGSLTVSKQSISVMLVIPAGGDASRVADEWAFVRAYIDANLTALIAGVV